MEETMIVKGKAASITGLIISIISLPLSGLVFFIAYVNNFDRVWTLIAIASGGLALVSFLFSAFGRRKIKSSGGTLKAGSIGMALSLLALITSVTVIGIGACTKQAENEKFDDKAFDKEKGGFDSLLNALNAAGDTTKKDSLKK